MPEPQLAVLMTYWKRPQLLKQTLATYGRYPPPVPTELLVMHDSPDDGDEDALAAVLPLCPFPARAVTIHRPEQNPGVLYNMAAEMTRAPVLALTNPECAHQGPIFAHAMTHTQPGRYLVYAARAQRQDGGRAEWYQHSQQAPRCLHFMSVIQRVDWPGFDPAYDKGLAFEDNDLVMQLKTQGMEIPRIVDLLDLHLYHDRTHHRPRSLWERNRDLFQRKWHGQSV